MDRAKFVILFGRAGELFARLDYSPLSRNGSKDQGLTLNVDSQIGPDFRVFLIVFLVRLTFPIN